MNISSEIFPTDGLNSSDHFFYNGTEEEIDFETSTLVGMIAVLLGFPTNAYVIWLIVTGTGNGLAAEFFSLNLSLCGILLSTHSPWVLIGNETEHVWILTCFLEALAMTGHPLFQCLICVERYLAVVHPVTFLKFKPLRYRVICCVIAWMASFGSGGVSVVTIWFLLLELYFAFFLAQFFLFLSIQLFCCVSALRALKQSGPGERRKEREENCVKRKAFYLFLISTVTMVTIYIPFIILIYFTWNTAKTPNTLLVFGYIFFTSSGLVQPLLFIYRVGKLPFINYH